MYCTLGHGGAGVDGQLIMACRGSHMAVLCPSISHARWCGCEEESCCLADSLPACFGFGFQKESGPSPPYLTPRSACPSRSFALK